MRPTNHSRLRAASIAAAAVLTLTTAGLTATQLPAAAATGCAVTYTVSSSWPGGFNTNVSVTNLGDPISSWRLTWTFTAGQTVTQYWNTTLTQTGAAVTAANVSYNGSIPTGGSTSFGFNGAATGSNPTPTSFALNGTTCTGGVSTPPTTTPPPTTPPPTTPPPGSNGPCDIYAAGGTPCVAAHSTTRALFGAYTGRLYQVRRASDNTTRDINALSAGGPADSAVQDSFCANTSCLITVIYDQTTRGNHLTQAPPGGFSGPAPGGYDNLADAKAAPTTVLGHRAYGVFVAPGTGYRDNTTNGIAKGDQPEGMYAIFDGTHYNGGCCFDYGNAETNSRDNGNGTMEAIYFGNIKVWGYGTGNGPWIMADLENGLFSGVNPGYNANDPSISHRYLTAIVKGEPNHWAIRGGNAQSGGLSTFYDGKRPNVAGYNPMKKEGAIILGIGGDNSHGAAGTFYEGVMTSGYPSNATEDAVQANITAAGYR
ncbi:arabinofuranosidase catalytic domain-containing protein [Micromonospora robiginosa]|uniref:Arabinofuranosidase catalytic domain-containing protein n=1 Tax=Micromonospora robiginosa TaxID=2749844 RepID=A0AAF0P5G9_9ACTN|nr:arabinofuranosidase catalytic domain-containing protein [Micromonospora ferruginea]WMF04498.1 arabinofuranosidase catalytic domain-containing protein [Micromonospora ferruginea]